MRKGDHLTDCSTNHGEILVFHIIVNSDPSRFVLRKTKLGSREGPVDERCEPPYSSQSGILRRHPQYRVGREGVIMKDCHDMMRGNEREKEQEKRILIRHFDLHHS